MSAFRTIPALIITAVILVANVGAPSLAQEASITRHRDWQVITPDQSNQCFATTQILLKRSESPLASLTLRREPEAADATTPQLVGALISVRVPLGVSLKSGIAYRHRGASEAVGLEWQYCNDEICLASGRISSEELNRLKRESSITLAFQPLPNSRPLALPVSLLGLTAAWNAVEACADAN